MVSAKAEKSIKNYKKNLLKSDFEGFLHKILIRFLAKQYQNIKDTIFERFLAKQSQ